MDAIAFNCKRLLKIRAQNPKKWKKLSHSFEILWSGSRGSLHSSVSIALQAGGSEDRLR